MAPVKIKKHKPTTVESLDIDQCRFVEWLDEQEPGTKEAVIKTAEDVYSPVELYLYCRFLGYNQSILDLEQWFKDNYPKEDHRRTLLDEIELMKEDMRLLRESVEMGTVKRDAGVARLASMEKELRGAIAQVESTTSLRDRKGLLMAGADRAIREILYIFKDDPLENALEEASMAVWARINSEN